MKGGFLDLTSPEPYASAALGEYSRSGSDPAPRLRLPFNVDADYGVPFGELVEVAAVGAQGLRRCAAYIVQI
jgi:hypothetical protein